MTATAAQRIREYLDDAAGQEIPPRSDLRSGQLVRGVKVNVGTWHRWFSETPPSGRTRLDPSVRDVAGRLLADIEQHGGWIDRAKLVELAKACTPAATPGALVTLHLATMMWGSGTSNGRGPWRTYQSLEGAHLDSTHADRSSDLVTTLADTVAAVGELAHEPSSVAVPQLADVWSRLRINGVGPSFFTKLMWAASLAHDDFPGRPLILDVRVSSALRALYKSVGAELPALHGADGYVAYMQLLESLVREIDDPRLSTERLEYLLFWRSKKHPEQSLAQWVTVSPGP